MNTLKPALLILIVFVFSVSVNAQNKEPKFPTDDEIRLVVTQTERAVNQYKPLLDMQEKMMGKEGAEALAKDRETVKGLEAAIAGFGKNPQSFNSSLGFAFFEWLDDASRNASLSSATASQATITGLLKGDREGTLSSAELAKDFANVSNVFYTVSENAGALYLRYVEGEGKLAKAAFDTATQCTDILKKNVAKP